MNNKTEAVSSVVRAFYPKTYAKWLKQRYVKDIPKYLGGDEWPEAVLFGKPNFGPRGGLWATNKRLLWVSHSVLGPTVKDYTYEKINSTEHSPIGGVFTMRFSTGGFSAFTLFHVDKNVVLRFTEFVRTKMTNISAPARAQPVTQASEVDLPAQLERLGQLKSQGLISEEEFKAAKARLLGL